MVKSMKKGTMTQQSPETNQLTRQDGPGVVLEERRVPDPQQAQQHREVLPHGRLKEVLVHIVGPSQELLHYGETVLQRQGQHSNGRAHGISTANPVPRQTTAVIGFRLLEGSIPLLDIRYSMQLTHSERSWK